MQDLVLHELSFLSFHSFVVLRDREEEDEKKGELSLDNVRVTTVRGRVSDPDPQDPHVFALPGSGSGQKGKEMNE